MVILIIFLWLLCGLGAAGAMFAYVQDEWPVISKVRIREDLGMCTAIGFLGPLSLLAVTYVTGFWKHGWRLWPKQ